MKLAVRRRKLPGPPPATPHEAAHLAFSLRGKRIAAFDGLRGAAIVAIMAYHFVRQFPRPQEALDRVFFELLSAGWIGVELFFVLSGFLATAVLCESKPTPHFMRTFHVRRSLRVLPLYFGLLFVLFVAVPLFAGHTQERVHALTANQWWFWFFLCNWFFALQGGFGTAPGGYLWWLSLDQQFCILWPLAVRWLNRRAMIALSAGLFVGSLVVRVVLLTAGVGPVVVYLITFSHLDGLAFGCLLALAMRSGTLSPPVARLLRAAATVSAIVLAGLFLLRGEFVFWDIPTVAVSPTLLAACFGWLLVASCRSEGGETCPARWRLLTSPVLLSFGRYSYGLYLLHPLVGRLLQPAFAPLQRLLGGSAMAAFSVFIAVAIAASWGVAVASWHLFEQPMARLRERIPQAKAFAR
ncbi:MAG: acyltransferase [Thermoguttaceae bacterium]